MPKEVLLYCSKVLGSKKSALIEKKSITIVVMKGGPWAGREKVEKGWLLG